MTFVLFVVKSINQNLKIAMNKVFHVRVKVESHTTFYLKGVCIAKTKKLAIETTLKEVNNYVSKSTKGDNRKISIIECKELRSDFLLHHK